MAYSNPNSNAYGQKAKQYKQQAIETATQEELLIMLYDGAIRFVLLAKKAFAQDDIEKYHNNIMRAQKIIAEFMASLDAEVGGELTKNLLKLYEYLHYRLVQANIKKDPDMLDEVLDHLRQLKATWEEAIDIANKERLEGKDPTLLALPTTDDITSTPKETSTDDPAPTKPKQANPQHQGQLGAYGAPSSSGRNISA